MSVGQFEVAQAYAKTAQSTVEAGPMLLVRLYDRLAHELELAKELILAQDPIRSQRLPAARPEDRARPAVQFGSGRIRGRPDVAAAVQHPGRAAGEGQLVQRRRPHRACANKSSPLCGRRGPRPCPARCKGAPPVPSSWDDYFDVLAEYLQSVGVAVAVGRAAAVPPAWPPAPVDRSPRLTKPSWTRRPALVRSMVEVTERRRDDVARRLRSMRRRDDRPHHRTGSSHQLRAIAVGLPGGHIALAASAQVELLAAKSLMGAAAPLARSSAATARRAVAHRLPHAPHRRGGRRPGVAGARQPSRGARGGPSPWSPIIRHQTGSLCERPSCGSPAGSASIVLSRLVISSWPATGPRSFWPATWVSPRSSISSRGTSTSTTTSATGCGRWSPRRCGPPIGRWPPVKRPSAPWPSATESPPNGWTTRSTSTCSARPIDPPGERCSSLVGTARVAKVSTWPARWPSDWRPSHPDVGVVWVTPSPPLHGPLGEVVVSPSQPQLAQRYREATVFVGVSRYESFSLAPLEAMASGTAVVSVANSGVQAYARHGENCFWSPSTMGRRCWPPRVGSSTTTVWPPACGPAAWSRPEPIRGPGSPGGCWPATGR